MRNSEEVKINEKNLVSVLQLGIKLSENDNKMHSQEKMFELFKIFFREIIDEPTLSDGIRDYRDVNIAGKVDDFLINFENFKRLVEANQQYKYCKFYFLQDNGILNIGLAFSDHDNIELEVNDVLYTIQGNDFLPETNFNKKKNDFKSGLSLSMGASYSTIMTEMIIYELDIVFLYNALVSHSYKVEKLKLKMFRYPVNYPKDQLKSGKISFAINPVMLGLRDSQTKSFDAGDLKP